MPARKPESRAQRPHAYEGTALVKGGNQAQSPREEKKEGLLSFSALVIFSTRGKETGILIGYELSGSVKGKGRTLPLGG